MKKIWDNIVIGSGMGGLTTAALLARSGQSVLILEKGISPGGCCSSFSRSGYIFESGATTLIGWEKGLPLVRLETELGITFPKVELPISMKVYLDEKVLVRYHNPSEWIQECVRVFGNPIKQKAFWRFTFYLSQLVWDLSARYSHFPLQSIRDLFPLLKSFRLKDTIALVFSMLTTEQVLLFFGLSKDARFRAFLNEQLMITNQCSVEEAPFLSASAGLTYPNLKNFYVPGGMVELPNQLLKSIEKDHGYYQNKSEVISLSQNSEDIADTNWTVTTKNESFHSKNVISNLPIWNLSELYIGKNESLKQAAREFEKGIWGAFTLGIAICTDEIKEECLHHQIHAGGDLPHGGGKSIFVSISHEKDSQRSKDGIRILSISTHLEEPQTWDRKSLDYQTRKKELTDSVLALLEKTFTWFDKEKIVSLHAATPATWSTWTARKFGRVGGIPSRYFRNPFRFLSPISQIPNLYLTGDTVYPGQGIPAVCLGGMNLAKRMLARKRD